MADKITDFYPDKHNANKGTEKGAIVLDDSIHLLGLGRSIVVDKNGNIIAGNKTQETAIQNGFEDAIVIESDGQKLVVVKRTDLDLYSDTDDRARLLGIMDNRSSELNLEWNTDNLDMLLQNINSDSSSVQAALSELAIQTGITPPINPMDEWVGMPEFEQGDISAPYSIKVNFNTLEDLEDFAILIGQPKINSKTAYIYHPILEHEKFIDNRVIDEP